MPVVSGGRLGVCKTLALGAIVVRFYVLALWGVVVNDHLAPAKLRWQYISQTAATRLTNVGTESRCTVAQLAEQGPWSALLRRFKSCRCNFLYFILVVLKRF